MIKSGLDMPFLDHLEEFRWRLIKSIIAILIGSFITYGIGDEIIRLLVQPTNLLNINMNLQVLKVTSMFSIKLSVALFGGIIIGFPIILFQCWRFISPAFEGEFGFSIFFTILFSSIFFIFGMLFSYFLIIPFSLTFFTSLTSNTIPIDYNFTLEGYLLYVLWLLFGSGLLFQLPVLSIFLTRIGILTPAFLRHYRKISIVILLVLSAILTPPDPLSQIIIVVPLILLYEFSILISKIFKPKDLFK